ncbi:cysteine ABC transporter permease [Gallibacterium salpingitidis]|uniref:Cysteine ABC transporter permease n=1 Tax=Gallibacterium salpingitidis TaxID=505341 RepID=A0AB36E5A2_9PAST|nr:cysteine ABC transporter permease [Gallibacterium salpingitidis]OBX11984.1 cysteine ABC transporter permease [Gallibacterium salpingitidis]
MSSNVSESISAIFHSILSTLPWMDDNKASIAIDAFFPMLEGMVYFTIPLTIISFLVGMLIALAIALIRVTPQKHILHRMANGMANFYISAIRGTPLLAQLFIIFYALPNVGITLDPLPTAIIAFSLNTGAYASETVRAAILSVPKGQWEAGYTIGMSYWQNFFRIIGPQALRVAVPPLSNSFIGLVKETSLASVVLVPEMMRQANIISSRTYEFLLIYCEAALMYWIVCAVLSYLQQRLEKHFERYVAR